MNQLAIGIYASLMNLPLISHSRPIPLDCRAEHRVALLPLSILEISLFQSFFSCSLISHKNVPYDICFTLFGLKIVFKPPKPSPSSSGPLAFHMLPQMRSTWLEALWYPEHKSLRSFLRLPQIWSRVPGPWAHSVPVKPPADAHWPPLHQTPCAASSACPCPGS